MVEALADTIRSELSFQVVAVRLRERAADSLRCVAVLGDEEARDPTAGLGRPVAGVDRAGRVRARAPGRDLAATGSYEWEDESSLWVPPTAAGIGPDAWDPDDMLMLPLRDGSGEVLGMVSVDQPLSGRRPTDEELSTLMAVCHHAGLALAQVERDTENAAAVGRRSSELLLGAVMLLAETLDLRDEGTARHSQTVGVIRAGNRACARL